MSVTTPVDVTVISFKGSHFHGEIVPALEDVVERGLIRIIDLVFVSKDLDGNVVSIELDDVSPELSRLLPPLTGETSELHSLFSKDEVAEMAESVQPGSSAAMIVFEQTWVNRLREAVANANGQVMTYERIPAEVIEQTLQSRQMGVEEGSDGIRG